jgi:TonB family protein
LPTEAQHAPAAAPVVFGHADQTPPRPLANLPPVYPEQAVAARWQGVTLLRVHVVADGAAADVEVLSSSGHAVLDAAAVRAVRTWRFEPARHNGRPVAAAVRLPVRFQLD